MIPEKKLRIMWLLNHNAARKFEIAMLKSLGINQIFLPKKYPPDTSFRSASVDYSEDCHLDIPAEDLEVLNAADWYKGADRSAWEIANKYFDVVFFILFYPEGLSRIARYFKGAVIWRAYGLNQAVTHGQLVNQYRLRKAITQLGRRFYFGEAYNHLADCEPDFLKKRRLYLPLGLTEHAIKNTWEGKDRTIFFVCPDIGCNPYYREIYEKFCVNFAGLPYVIAGAQPIVVRDPNVLGYVSHEAHERNMTQSRVMFYHSQEPNHIHYHPFEAVRVGMPLVFMAGGLLDRMGGRSLPGRCTTIKEAREKIERILADDWAYIDKIRVSQHVLLERMQFDRCMPNWISGFAQIASELKEWQDEQVKRPLVSRPQRIALIVPAGYKGGSLRGAIVLAEVLWFGSRQSGQPAEIIFCHLDDPQSYAEDDFAELPAEIKRRSFTWKNLTAAEARRAMHYAGETDWEPLSANYAVPDDGMQQLEDCDLWLFISDRLTTPLLPLKPVVLIVYDYLQRYVDLLSHGADQAFLDAARNAQSIWVTTKFTQGDALQYAGIEPSRVSKMPMLVPDFSSHEMPTKKDEKSQPYFIWTTNSSPDKNHIYALKALRIYYEELDGQWACKITGVNTAGMLKKELPHLKQAAEIVAQSKALRKQLQWLGELPDAQYRNLLARARCLWHPAQIDNGTFSVIEAAYFGVPALSSDYPAMREIDEQFQLNMAWMQHDAPRNMALQLKQMETEAAQRRASLPDLSQMRSKQLSAHAASYWQEVHAWL